MMGSGIIPPSGSTISSQKLVMSPSALPPDPNIMNVMAVKENEATNRPKREFDSITLPNTLQAETLPEAAALSATYSDDASNKTLSSLKDPLNSSRNSIKSLSSKGKANRDQNSKSSKQNRKQKTSKLKGIFIFIHKNCDRMMLFGFTVFKFLLYTI